ncbi:hypothetical protein CTM93_12490 [Photobacterium phosphoreum]|uniref:hypothetical protein n=1 Tax=Photobacterium phosphoreum TaxID=659 RepID=UPI000D1866A8|nr:hypothetical protein [Photobacterium phosphoreum]PSU82896.1 hypothetical protein CTM93_12490 [Photobacterium phosphoreum]
MERPTLENIIGGSTDKECVNFHQQSYVKSPKTALNEFNGNYATLAQRTTQRLAQRRTRKIKRVLSNHVSKPMITIDDLF